MFVIGSHPEATTLIGTSTNFAAGVNQFSAERSPARLPDVKDLRIEPNTDVALIQFSSGTTGLPKAVCLSHYNVTAIQTGFE